MFNQRIWHNRHRRGIATKGSLLGPNREKYYHPEEDEYMAFRPVKVREEKRRMWTGSRYEMRTCVVYDAGQCEQPEPFDEDRWGPFPEKEARRKRSSVKTKQLLDSMCKLLDADGPATAAEIASVLQENPNVIRSMLQKGDIFVVVGRHKRVAGQLGGMPYVYDVLPASRI